MLIAVIVIFSPLIFVLAILGITFFVLGRLFTYLLVWGLWLPRGKDVLFISSDSPVWQALHEGTSVAAGRKTGGNLELVGPESMAPMVPCGASVSNFRRQEGVQPSGSNLPATETGAQFSIFPSI